VARLGLVRLSPRVLLATAGAAFALFASSASAAPNVVLVLTDDQRWDTLSAMPTVESELVGKGVTFTNAFVVNPLCCPSRATILTGLYSHTTRVYKNGQFGRFDDSSTIATRLRHAGYRTAFLGKYLNSYRGTYVPPGWTYWSAFTPANVASFFDYELNIDGTITPFGSAPGDYSTDVLATQTEDFIRSANGPFFLVLSTYAPHPPATPAPRHGGAFPGLAPWRPPSYDEADVSDKPGYVATSGPIPDRGALDQFRRSQLQSLLAVDDAVARTLDVLEDTGQLANTVVMFMSDNGFLWGEHRLTGKQAPYEESIRVPLVVRYDAEVAAPRTDSRLVANVDIAPTIAHLAGVARSGMQGRTLRPLLRGVPTGWRTELLVESARSGPNTSIPGYCAVRGRRFVYVVYETHEQELYDLATDPAQLTNRVREPGMHARRSRLRSLLLGLCNPPPPGVSLKWICTKTGTPGPDVIRGGAGLDALCGKAGPDTLLGGRGNDRLTGGPGLDRLVGGPGNDRFFALDRAKDTISCGRGRDRVTADKRDVVGAGCEWVKRG
jgi:arylsulfatase A-like enzyme